MGKTKEVNPDKSFAYSIIKDKLKELDYLSGQFNKLFLDIMGVAKYCDLDMPMVAAWAERYIPTPHEYIDLIQGKDGE